MIIIYTVCYNTPKFVEPQYNLLKKYISDKFEYIVFNNRFTMKISPEWGDCSFIVLENHMRTR